VDGGREALTVAALAGGDAIVITARSHAWWLGDPTGPFHFVWGMSISAGQNVLLHAATAYQAAQVLKAGFDWACVPSRSGAWFAAALGFAAQVPKQIGDGFHAEGFSVSEALWSGAAAGLVGVRDAWTPASAVRLKGWYWPSDEYQHRVGAFPTLESDYAGQRYFLAIDPGLVPGASIPFPRWLGIAVGHGVDHWISGTPDPIWYLTLDLNLRGLPITARWWQTVAAVLDQIHVPLPGLRFETGQARAGVY